MKIMMISWQGREAIETLDVPVEIAREQALRCGEEVWAVLVRNPYARLAAGEAARYMLNAVDASADFDERFLILMRALMLDIPGVRDAVCDDARTPGWLVKWMLDENLLSDEQTLVLVNSTRNLDALWFLGWKNDVIDLVRLEARRRGSRYPSQTWIETEFMYREMILLELRVRNRERADELENLWDGLVRGDQVPTGERTARAEQARRLLGDGESGGSLSAWERLFDLAAAGLDATLERLIEAAALSASGEKT